MTPNLTFADWRRDRLIALADALGGDGHSIINPFSLAESMDLHPAEAVYLGSLSEMHYSGEHFKEKITDSDTGNDLKELFGLHTLRVYRQMASDLDVKYMPKMGRGSEAQSILKSLRAHFAERQLT